MLKDALKKSTTQEPAEVTTSCLDDDTSTEDPDLEQNEDEQDKENDIQQSDERNHAEINNVISDNDAADFVDKLLKKINAAQEKDESFSKKKGKKNLCKSLHKRRDV